MRKVSERPINRFYLVFCLCALIVSSAGAAPAIELKNVPAYGTYGELSGVVVGGNPATQKIAVFAYVGGGWYSKPSCAQHLTSIQPDGSWSADITPVASDINATIIAALLVSSNYSQPCVNGAAGLPASISQQALATAYVSRFNPAARQIQFSDYTWWVKKSSGKAGPGPNYFSDSTDNVYVDDEGRLHLKITQRNGQWHCAEVISARTFGYGQYRFTVSGPVDDLDPNAILGLFTWSNDAAYNNREIDVELTRWGNPNDTNNAQFAVQPATTPQLQRVRVPAGVTNSTYTFTWRPGRVDFQALRGEFSATPASSDVIRTWSCQLGVPLAGGENIRFNLWLNKGYAPLEGQEIELIISSFEFVPLGAAEPAQIRSLNWFNGMPQLDLAGQMDRRYQIIASSNLLDWTPLDRVLATNNIFQFTDARGGSTHVRYYRTITEP